MGQGGLIAQLANDTRSIRFRRLYLCVATAAFATGTLLAVVAAVAALRTYSSISASRQFGRPVKAILIRLGPASPTGSRDWVVRYAVAGRQYNEVISIPGVGYMSTGIPAHVVTVRYNTADAAQAWPPSGVQNGALDGYLFSAAVGCGYGAIGWMSRRRYSAEN